MRQAPSRPRPHDPIDQHGDLGGCVALERLYDGSLVRLVSWHCLRDGPELRSERQHEHAVLGFLHHGACSLEHSHGPTVVDPNCLLLHPPHVPYSTSHPFGCGDQGVHMVVRRDVAEEILDDRAPHLAEGWRSGKERRIHVLPNPSSTFLRHRVLVHDLRHDADGVLAVEENALELLAHLADSLDVRRIRPKPRRPGTREDHLHLVDETRSLLQRRFRESLTLADMARALHTSPYHLSRVFKRETGFSLHNYRTRLRLAAALDHLAHGGDDLTRLALDLGFASPSHLSTSFRRTYGLPPSAVRRRFSPAPLR